MNSKIIDNSSRSKNLGYIVLLMDLKNDNDYKKIFDITKKLTNNIQEKRSKYNDITENIQNISVDMYNDKSKKSVPLDSVDMGQMSLFDTVKDEDVLEELKDKIPGLLDISIQTDNILPSSNADIMLDSSFESEEALKGYAVHPVHVAVANTYVRPYTAIRSCLDFEK